MKKIILACALLIALPAWAQTNWQITIGFSHSGGQEILDAQRISNTGKVLSHPGMTSSVETQAAHVAWIRKGVVLKETDAEIPYGNRYGQPALQDGVSVVRLAGPDEQQAGDIVEVELQGVRSRFGIPVSGFVPRSAGQIFRYTTPKHVAMRDGPVSASRILTTGPDSNRYVIVVLGDGYRTQELSSGQFTQDAQTIVSYLGSQAPWDELTKITNIYTVDVASVDTGADDPCASDAAPGCVVRSVNTYFNTSFGSYGIDRNLGPDSTGQARAIAAADALVGAGKWDSLLLIVNTAKYGGSGGTISTISMHASATEVAVHELGHTIGGLADEYTDAYPGFPETITEPNADSDGASPKWLRWVTSGVSLPTPDNASYDGVVGAFEGARYKTTGVYRPMRTCKMKELGVAFCPICKEALFEGVLNQVRLYDTVSPAAGKTVTVGKKASKFKFTSISAGTVSSNWTVCGKTLARNVSSVSVSRSKIKSRSCTLKLKLTLSSELLRENAHTKTVQWKLKK